MKKGLRPQDRRESPQLQVRTTSLMKKGLRLVRGNLGAHVTRQNDFPDEEGITTFFGFKVTLRNVSERLP